MGPEDEDDENSGDLSTQMDHSDADAEEIGSHARDSPIRDENVDCDANTDSDNREYTPMEEDCESVSRVDEANTERDSSERVNCGARNEKDLDVDNVVDDPDVKNGRLVVKEELEECDSLLKQQLMSKLFFPRDLLTLRKVDESEFTVTGIPWSVLSRVPLAKGQRMGPYSGELVALSSIKPGELVLQFQTSDGDLSFIKVTDEAGAWLSLLRPGEHTAAHNICVYFEYGKVWCEVEEDLKTGVELVASFTTTSSGQASTIRERDVSSVVPSASKKHESKSIPQLSPQHALIYGCPFCSVRFSSPRTLEAHLTYYCSKKPADFVSLQQLQQRLEQQAAAAAVAASEARMPEQTLSNGTPSPKIKTELSSPAHSKRSSSEKSESGDGPGSDRESPGSKTGDIYKCRSCNFVSETLSGLTKHQQTHGRSTPGDSPICQEEMFCKHCNIQFSSLSTYRGHKEFYCQYRQRQSSGASDESETATPVPREILKSPNVSIDAKGQLVPGKGGIHPGLLIPGLLNQSQFLLQAMSKDMPFYLKGLEREPVSANMKPLLEQRSGKSAESQARCEDQPLDLSKGKQATGEETGAEEADRTEQKSPENIFRAGIKSEPRSPDTRDVGSPMKKQKLDPSSDEPLRPSMKATLNIPTIPTLLGPGAVQFVNKKPIPPLQMVSRCVECNIVFYKHENYLIHKEHYCSGRRATKDTSSAESDVSETDGKEQESGARQEGKLDEDPSRRRHIPSDSVNTDDSSVKALNNMHAKHFCTPCNIRFSSAGTLKAHTDFYCPHGKENTKGGDKRSGSSSPNAADDSGYHCDNCKSDFPSARLLKLHFCRGDSSPSPLLRCLYCDYVTQTEHRLSEHMKVHVPTKAFKCNICGYRGNTARGMRMHGKVHIESGEEFTDDNMIEYEEPPLVPIQRNGFTEKGPVDMETELIRMKNEPYKRRRSRKSFEKSENMVPLLAPTLLPQTCVACGQTFGNWSDFVIHLKMHEIAALEAMKNSAKKLHCEHCSDYIADSLTSLLGHMQSKHPEHLLGGKSESEAASRSEGERSQSRDSQSSHDRSRTGSVESSRMTAATAAENGQSNECEQSKNYEKTVVKTEVDENVASTSLQTASDHISNGIESDELKKDLDEQKKSPNSVESNRDSEINGSQTGASPVHRDAPSPPSAPSTNSSPDHLSAANKPLPRNKSSSPQQSPSSSTNGTDPNLVSSKLVSIKDENTVLSPRRFSPDPKTRYLQSQSIKKEQISPPLVVSPRPQPASPRTPSASPKLPFPPLPQSPKLQNLPLLYSQQAMLAMYQYPPGIPASLIPAHPGIVPSAIGSASSPGEKNGRKYCKHCDINFTYLSSFLTHKKYYCSARTSSPDEAESPTATA